MADLTSDKATSPTGSRMDYWFATLCGTALSGGVFGALFGVFVFTGQGLAGATLAAAVGLALGALAAGLVASPVLVFVAFLTRILRLGRAPAYPALMVGGVTGMISAAPLATEGFTNLQWVPTIAGVIGALGTWTVVAWWARRERSLLESCNTNIDKPITRKSSVFLHVRGVVTTGLVFCVAGLSVLIVVRHADESSRRMECANELKRFALVLVDNERQHKSLSPAFLTNKAGKPTLSWRTILAKYLYYDDEPAGFPNVELPWNQQKNQSRIDRKSLLFHCPSSGKSYRDLRTDYVAVVGPDTLWPGTTGGDLRKHPKAILLVEWPKSDIHWLEPRDVTVEEFLDWFRHPPQRSFWDWLFVRRHDHNSFHPDGLLYVDGECNVGVLRNDTDPEVVRRMLRGE